MADLFPYITRAEFKALGIPDGAWQGLDVSAVDQAILSCSAVANSYFKKRATLPLLSWGEDVKLKVADLVQFQLLSLRGFRPDSGNDQVSVDRRDTALEWFRDVARGLVEPDWEDSTAEVDEEGTLAASGPAMNFSMSTRGACGRCGNRCGGCCDDEGF